MAAGSLFSQVFSPVSWNFSFEQTATGESELVFEALIDDTWHLYSQHLPEGGPIPTSFVFEGSDNYKRIGEVVEVTEADVVYDSSFELELKMFSHKAEFRQKIEIIGQEDFILKGYVEFMSCDDERCLPPTEEDFSFSIKAATPAEAVAGEKQSASKTITASNTDTAVETSDSGSTKEGSGLLGFFFLAMLTGLAGILTPCVFPMIPMTVAFFSQGTSRKAASILKAFIFGLSITFIYTAIGLVVSLTSAGADFANNLSTHWIPNTIFFLLFMVFAASFLGLFEMVLPSSLVNRADRQADKGGYVAAFFMGLTTVLVSFSCTGPIVGALLVEAASGDVIKPTIGMFGFGLAFALPFTLFAIFPSWMQKLPKSGGWLNSVKVVLGFIVLAFGMKFLLTIDLSYHLNIFTRELYLAIWIVIFSMMGFYLLGKIKFALDSDLPKIGFFRAMLVIAIFSFVLYLVPGMFGAPLNAVSGLIPPMDRQSFVPGGSVTATVPASLSEGDNQKSANCDNARYSDFLHLPYGLDGYFEYKQGMECAREQNKPVLLDFKGHACSNCKEMESKVWSDPEVLERLREDFVIIALYVDDRSKLPEEEWLRSEIDGKIKKTIGKVNADLQISMFEINSQPYYIIVDHQGRPLTEAVTHNLKISAFVDFLDKGKQAFDKESVSPVFKPSSSLNPL